MLKYIALKITLFFVLLNILGFCSLCAHLQPSPYSASVSSVLLLTLLCMFFLSARQHTVHVHVFFQIFHQHKPIPALTNVSRSPTGGGHDAVLLHFRQAEVRDHDFGVLLRSEVKKVFRL